MPSDLIVVSVKLPSPVKAPCPSTAVVTIRNVGTDPPDADEFVVSVEIAEPEGPFKRFDAVVRGRETSRIGVGQTIDVAVPVVFPCWSSARLVATADSTQRVPNNLRTSPSLTLNPVAVLEVPILVLSMRVGLEDSFGVVTWDPYALCPGREILVEVSLTNSGCWTSSPAVTEVVFEDANATPPVILGQQTVTIPWVDPSHSQSITVRFTTPTTMTTTSGTLVVRAAADTTFANPDLCDRSRLTTSWARPFAIGAPPRLTFEVGGAGTVRPGESPALVWTLDNGCTEVGDAIVTVLFGATPLYSAPRQIGLRARLSETIPAAQVVVPTTVANAFWSLGVKQLEIRVESTALGGVGFGTTAPLTVVPDTVDITWWRWPAPPAIPPVWKSTYAVRGTFTNRASFATMTVTALTVLEHPTDITGTALDATVAPAAGGPPITVGPGVTAGGTTWTRRQAWTWLQTVAWVEVGPRVRTFSYIATFTLVDSFGNTYSPVSSMVFLVPVAVPARKIGKFGLGWGLIQLGLFTLSLAVLVAVAGGPYGWIAAVILAAAGMAFLIAATFLMYDALDPPVPDFAEGRQRVANPIAWRLASPEDDRLHALYALTLLVGRLVSSRAAVTEHRGRAWAGFVDADESAQAQHRDAVRREMSKVDRIVEALVDAADESQDIWDELTAGAKKAVVTSKDVRAMLPKFAAELGLTDRELRMVDELVAHAEPDHFRRSAERVSEHGLRELVRVAQGVRDDMVADNEARDFLR
jgi:hypothetical protein